MGWRSKKADNFLPVWWGKDSIYNVPHTDFKGVSSASTLMIFFPIVMKLFAGGGSVGEGLSKLLMIIMIPIGIAFFIHAYIISDEFIGSKWSLWAEKDALVFDGAEKWTVPLDALARVEIARTHEYRPSRKYQRGLFSANDVLPVPEHEWQTFLFLNDGTRRVIYHANAARDDCAALAASIREYVESARAGAVASSPSTHDAAGDSAPRAAGFDL